MSRTWGSEQLDTGVQFIKGPLYKSSIERNNIDKNGSMKHRTVAKNGKKLTLHVT